MRTAPAISIDAPVMAGWRATQAFLHAAAAAALVAWAMAHLGSWSPSITAPAGLAAGLAATVAAGIAAGAYGWWSSRTLPTWLAWTGGEWRLRAGGAPEIVVLPPQPMLDFNGFLLLRIQPEAGRAQWLAVTRRASGAAWHPMRAAVYSFASPQRLRSPAERPPF